MNVQDMTWQDHQATERAFWGDCLRTFGEEAKQLEYAWRMGLRQIPHGGQWPVYDLQGKNVLDIGGGPVSMLLKCVNRGHYCTVVDPCEYPDWVRIRYVDADIDYKQKKGEDLGMTKEGTPFAEVWIYNVLQHTDDPEKIIAYAKRAAPVLRIFEWINFPPHEGHPHELKEELLDEWIGQKGTVETMTGQNGCVGDCYYGVFTHTEGQADLA